MKAFVSIIRYVPDPARGECVNVGAAVACADLAYFKFEIPRGQLERLKWLDPRFSWQLIEGYEDWLSESEEYFIERSLSGTLNGASHDLLREITRMSASDPIQVGPFRPVEFESDVGKPELDEVLADVLARDVRWFKDVAASKPQQSTFQTRVGEALSRAGLYKPRARTSPIRAKYRLPNLDLEFDYGYKNGTHHVIETADIRNVHDENVIVERAAAVIVKFQRIEHAAAGSTTKRITILSGRRKAGKAVSPTIRELKKLSSLYYFGEDQERRQLIKRVERDLMHEG